MNTELTTAAVERLTAQLGEALFKEPGLDLIEIANRCNRMAAKAGSGLLVADHLPSYTPSKMAASFRAGQNTERMQDKPEAVRLRDELRERAEFEAWAQSIGAAVDDDEHGNYVDSGLNHAKLGWQAALAATGKQQVGEVQGAGLDVEQLKSLVSSVHRTVALGHQRGPHAYSGENFGRYLAEAARDCRQIMGLLDALAARQPVGQEPVVTAEMLAAADAYHDSEEYRSGNLGDDHTNAACYRAMAAACPPAQSDQPYQRITGLQGIGDAADYLARHPGDEYAKRRLSERVAEFCQKNGLSPAQAVDLEQFIALAKFGEEFAFSAEKQPHSRVVYSQASRLLALIDGNKAVQS
ncbi:hypothetical protein [Stenotrophomonas sp. NPDC078853]|uniref:hypothetical protein n=1 Tax=Stenotrophomonas sp. NPDC078853 TaxID=3364534 RepID=UPI00384B19CC